MMPSSGWFPKTAGASSKEIAWKAIFESRRSPICSSRTVVSTAVTGFSPVPVPVSVLPADKCKRSANFVLITALPPVSKMKANGPSPFTLTSTKMRPSTNLKGTEIEDRCELKATVV